MRRRTGCRRRTRTGPRPQPQAPAPCADGPPDRQPPFASSACYASSGNPQDVLKISRPLKGSARLAPYTSAMAANPRRVPKSRNQGLTAKILMQQAEQQMVLPDAVDAEIAPRQPLAREAAFLQHPDRGRIRGNAGGLDAVQIELAEQRWQQHAQPRRHVAAMRMRLAD